MSAKLNKIAMDGEEEGEWEEKDSPTFMKYEWGCAPFRGSTRKCRDIECCAIYKELRIRIENEIEIKSPHIYIHKIHNY